MDNKVKNEARQRTHFMTLSCDLSLEPNAGKEDNAGQFSYPDLVTFDLRDESDLAKLKVLVHERNYDGAQFHKKSVRPEALWRKDKKTKEPIPDGPFHRSNPNIKLLHTIMHDIDEGNLSLKEVAKLFAGRTVVIFRSDSWTKDDEKWHTLESLAKPVQYTEIRALARWNRERFEGVRDESGWDPSRQFFPSPSQPVEAFNKDFYVQIGEGASPPEVKSEREVVGESFHPEVEWKDKTDYDLYMEALKRFDDGREKVADEAMHLLMTTGVNETKGGGVREAAQGRNHASILRVSKQVERGMKLQDIMKNHHAWNKLNHPWLDDDIVTEHVERICSTGGFPFGLSDPEYAAAVFEAAMRLTLNMAQSQQSDMSLESILSNESVPETVKEIAIEHYESIFDSAVSVLLRRMSVRCPMPVRKDFKSDEEYYNAAGEWGINLNYICMMTIRKNPGLMKTLADPFFLPWFDKIVWKKAEALVKRFENMSGERQHAESCLDSQSRNVGHPDRISEFAYKNWNVDIYGFPGMGKSTITMSDVCELLRRDPHARVMWVGYEDAQAQKWREQVMVPIGTESRFLYLDSPSAESMIYNMYMYGPTIVVIDTLGGFISTNWELVGEHQNGNWWTKMFNWLELVRKETGTTSGILIDHIPKPQAKSKKTSEIAVWDDIPWPYGAITKSFGAAGLIYMRRAATGEMVLYPKKMRMGGSMTWWAYKHLDLIPYDNGEVEYDIDGKPSAGYERGYDMTRIPLDKIAIRGGGSAEEATREQSPKEKSRAAIVDILKAVPNGVSHVKLKEHITSSGRTADNILSSIMNDLKEVGMVKSFWVDGKKMWKLKTDKIVNYNKEETSNGD